MPRWKMPWPSPSSWLSEFPATGPRQLQFQQRLQWGLRQYYLRQYRQEHTEEIEE